MRKVKLSTSIKPDQIAKIVREETCSKLCFDLKWKLFSFSVVERDAISRYNRNILGGSKCKMIVCLCTQSFYNYIYWN